MWLCARENKGCFVIADLLKQKTNFITKCLR